MSVKRQPAAALTVWLSVWALASSGGMVFGEELKAVLTPQKTAAARKATAEQLIGDAEKATAFLAKTLKDSADKTLDAKNVKQQPFWAALKRTSVTLEKIKTQLKARDPRFFETLNEGTQNAAELRSFYPRTGIKNARVELGVKTLSNALVLLRRNYGREAIRIKRGGELTEAEKDEFLQVKESQRTLVENLKNLEAQAAGNKLLAAEIKRMLSQLKIGIEAPLTLAAFHEARETLDVIEGEWNAYSYYVEPKFRGAWNASRTRDSLSAMENALEAVDELVLTDNFDGLSESMVVTGLLGIDEELSPQESEELNNYVNALGDLELEAYYAALPEGAAEDGEGDATLSLEDDTGPRNSESQGGLRDDN